MTYRIAPELKYIYMFEIELKKIAKELCKNLY